MFNCSFPNAQNTIAWKLRALFQKSNCCTMTEHFFFRLIAVGTGWKRYVLGWCLKNIEFTVGERCTAKKCSLSHVCVNYIYYIELVSINKLAQLQRYRSLFRGSAKEFLARPMSNLSTLPRCLAENWWVKTFCLFFFISL